MGFCELRGYVCGMEKWCGLFSSGIVVGQGVGQSLVGLRAFGEGIVDGKVLEWDAWGKCAGSIAEDGLNGCVGCVLGGGCE